MIERLKITILALSTLIVAYGLVGGLLERLFAGDEAYRDLSVFTKVLDRVRSDYVEIPDMQKAYRGAFHGMMEALDPYSSFVESDVYSSLKRENFDSGLGVSVSKRYGYIHVVSVVPGSPADSAGLRMGDLFETINGQPTTLMSLWEAQQHLSGSSSDPVTGRVIRSRHSQPLEINLVPNVWSAPEVSGLVIEGDLGIVAIPAISSDTAREVKAKLNLLLTDPIKGLLLDLRRCSEGDVADAVEVADLFLAKGQKIVTEKSKSGALVERVSLTEPLVRNLPVVLLVNSGTSGAAEVLVAALKDHQVGEVVGDRTNGKGSIQKEYILEDGSVLILTTRLLLRPNGDPIQAEEIRKSGIEPDVQSPTRNFVTDFYFDNSPEEDDQELGQRFYKSLDQAIEAEQLEEAIQRLRSLIEGESDALQVA